MKSAEIYDFVVIGSGGGGLCAALTAAAQGKRVVVLEKREKVGGSTAMSGGVLWLPNNPVSERAGLQDSFEDGMRYLQAVVGDAGPASSEARRRAFLQGGRAMIDFLEREGMQFYYADGYADYYDELPGGKARGRVLGAKIIGSRALGEWYPKLNQFEGWALPVLTDEFSPLTLVKRTWRGKLTALKVGLRAVRQQLTGQQLLCRGAALQARMLLLVLARKVPVLLNHAVEELMYDGERVTGVRVRRDGGDLVELRARDGVLIAAGGFARNAEMRKRYHPQPSSPQWSAANPGDTGELIEMAIGLGAATDMLDEAIWIPTSVLANGTLAGFHNPHDLAKPHVILVNKHGRRFVNEAASYMDLGHAMYRENSVPCWAIIERRHRERYAWGLTPPGPTPQEWFTSGYMKRAQSIDELASLCGFDRAVFRETIERFNAQASAGRDDDFKRGARAYDRYYADPTNTPNPSLGAIEKPPFYAVQILPGDVGTFGGILTDEHAAVLRPDGSRVLGLYATGNCTASVCGRTYPGGGASIAASFTFGHLAALHAASAAAHSSARGSIAESVA